MIEDGLTEHNVCFLCFFLQLIYTIQIAINQLDLGILTRNLSPFLAVADNASEFPIRMGGGEFVESVTPNVA